MSMVTFDVGSSLQSALCLATDSRARLSVAARSAPEGRLDTRVKFLGRRLHLASDDFVVPGIGATVFQVACGSVYVQVAAALARTFPNLSCLMWGCAVSRFLAGVLDVSIAGVSSRGPIWDETPRASLPRLLLLRLVMAVVEAITLVIQVILAFVHMRGLCALSRGLLAKLGCVVLFEMMGLLCVSCLWWCLRDVPMLGRQRSFVLMNSGNRSLVTLARWTGAEHTAGPLVDMFSRLLSGPNVTLSDVSMLITLLRWRQLVAEQTEVPAHLGDLRLHGFPWGDGEDRILRRSCGGALPDTRPLKDGELLEDLLRNLGFASAV